jgi:hypothetical protein
MITKAAQIKTSGSTYPSPASKKSGLRPWAKSAMIQAQPADASNIRRPLEPTALGGRPAPCSTYQSYRIPSPPSRHPQTYGGLDDIKDHTPRRSGRRCRIADPGGGRREDSQDYLRWHFVDPTVAADFASRFGGTTRKVWSNGRGVARPRTHKPKFI